MTEDDPGRNGQPPSPESERADSELLAELRAALSRLDPVPVSVSAAAVAAIDLRTLDAELAELIADSAVDAGALVRGAGEARLVSFAHPRLSIEFEVVSIAGARRLVGQVVGAGADAMELDHRRGVLAVAVDDLGRFGVEGVAPGPVRLRCVLPDGEIVGTSWVVV
jgi:hypothetical protein